MTGAKALAAYHAALGLVNEGRYAEARAVPLLSSDRAVIEQKIAQRDAKQAASANASETNCNRRILQDSQGGWFPSNEQPECDR